MIFLFYCVSLADPPLSDLAHLPTPAVAEATLVRGLALHTRLLCCAALSPRDAEHHRDSAAIVLARLTPWALLREAQGDSPEWSDLPPTREKVRSAWSQVYQRQRMAGGKVAVILFWRNELGFTPMGYLTGDDMRRCLLGEVRHRISPALYKAGKLPVIPELSD